MELYEFRIFFLAVYDGILWNQKHQTSGSMFEGKKKVTTKSVWSSQTLCWRAWCWKNLGQFISYSGGNNRFLGRNATFQENTFRSQFGGISSVFGARICQVSGNQKTLLQHWEHINALEKKIQLQSQRILVCENVTVPTKGAPFWWKSVKSRPWGPNPYDTIAAMKVEEPLWIFHQGIPKNYRNPADTSNCGLDDGLWFSCVKRQVGSMRQWLT